jgi:inhibitor of KinA
MKSAFYKIFPLGIDALTVDFGNEISFELNDKAVNLHEYFAKNPFAGFIETVPAYASLTIFYDISTVRRTFPECSTSFEAVKTIIENALENPGDLVESKARTIEIPVDFSDEFALDLDFVAAQNNLTKEKAVEIFTAETYRVFMLGFMPAFPYMGEVDRRIAAPRRPTPRLNVPRGSVGIAGRQTGIYPFESPGGWQIIGKTDFELFTPQNDQPCTLNPGDLVIFYDVNR